MNAGKREEPRSRYVGSYLWIALGNYGIEIFLILPQDSLMDFSQSALFLDLSFQFLIMHLLMSVCIQSHHLFFFGGPLTWLPWALLLNTWLTFLLLSILLTWPTQFNQIILTNESTFKSPNSCNSSLLYHFLQFSFTLVPPNILRKTFCSKAARCLAISLFNVQISAPYVATGLITVLQIFIFLLEVLTDSLVEEEVHNMLYLHLQFFFST